MTLHTEVVANTAPSTVFVACGDSSLDFYVKFFTHDVKGGIWVTSDINLMIWKI
ncbi:hypothetical protein [Synechococcus sp. MIT S9508]|uniref:hypothetical protein n=1 Tax=Synechococcus sp. MIT S9508 TaxID=1801629 RepID=UPI0007BC6360|nr:hypothetical protein MITS9508_02836 [Synechococcus sp. MIT S9508]